MLESNKVYLGDNLELLKQLDDNSIHSCVSDFPYNLGFMGKKWDTISNYQEWCNLRAVELFRVLKPGGYCLIFGGTRTHHRLVCGFEDAGFDIKDEIQWIYGSGFPKSYNISKGFDKKAGAEREVIGYRQHPTLTDKSKIDRQDKHQYHGENSIKDEWELTAPSTELAKQWEGFGTALKPAQEPIMVAQKPIEKNYCYNIEKYGVGGLNIDGSRIIFKNEDDKPYINKFIEKNGKPYSYTDMTYGGNSFNESNTQQSVGVNTAGRFPANIIFDEEAGRLLDEQSGITKSGKVKNSKDSYEGESTTRFLRGVTNQSNQYGDSGGASRFFYCAKASTKDKTDNGLSINHHPTVKPTSLIKYLVKLVTPPNGICLDMCEGSGTHVKSCLELTNEGYAVDYIGFENNEEYYNIILDRIQNLNNS